MNKPLLAAAIISALTVLLHVFGGGPQYHAPALLSNFTAEEKALYSVLWHAVTVTLTVNSVGLFLVATKRMSRDVGLIIVAQYALFAALFIFYGFTRLGTLWPLPQWVIFGAIAALALWGLRSKKQ